MSPDDRNADEVLRDLVETARAAGIEHQPTEDTRSHDHVLAKIFAEEPQRARVARQRRFTLVAAAALVAVVAVVGIRAVTGEDEPVVPAPVAQRLTIAWPGSDSTRVLTPGMHYQGRFPDLYRTVERSSFVVAIRPDGVTDGRAAAVKVYKGLGPEDESVSISLPAPARSLLRGSTGQLLLFIATDKDPAEGQLIAAYTYADEKASAVKAAGLSTEPAAFTLRDLQIAIG